MSYRGPKHGPITRRSAKHCAKCNYLLQLSGIAKLKKDELKSVAEKIGLVVTEGMKKSDIKHLIEESDVFKNDNEVVSENRNQKSDQDGQIEIERLKIERIKLELELAQLRANVNNTQTSVNQGCKNEPEESLDTLIKSVRALSTKPPNKSQDWGFLLIAYKY
ncbi:integrase catalytic domain-containing protein [Trichonephila inaurata madagascariensis]|uniref:Integrase catalytic domain-containing protein n=1 Tax=Trichonephila inaurata madagascariensis TaxID=2747483 RepID=A0A8X6YIY8_9ARAC|nr:integrase catalytic domain-containing protein [Trichonephila inaurata madagascariensis]